MTSVHPVNEALPCDKLARVAQARAWSPPAQLKAVGEAMRAFRVRPPCS